MAAVIVWILGSFIRHIYGTHIVYTKTALAGFPDLSVNDGVVVIRTKHDH